MNQVKKTNMTTPTAAASTAVPPLVGIVRTCQHMNYHVSWVNRGLAESDSAKLFYMKLTVNPTAMLTDVFDYYHGETIPQWRRSSPSREIVTQGYIETLLKCARSIKVIVGVLVESEKIKKVPISSIKINGKHPIDFQISDANYSFSFLAYTGGGT